MLSRKIAFKYKGVLENAGMAEVAYYLEKAKENVRYATFALDHTDLEAAKQSLMTAASKFDDLSRLLSELQMAVENIGVDVADGLEAKEFAAEEQE